ncbi:MAG: hypothetical protein U0Q16_17485 [Bryobacteraceae bacterium]
MRRLSLALMLALALRAQEPYILDSGTIARAEAELPPGNSEVRVALRLPVKPEAIDSFYLFVHPLPTGTAEVTLTDPEGRQITRETAEANGFRWSEEKHEGGRQQTLFLITAARTRLAGTYTAHVKGKGVPGKATVEFEFESRRRIRSTWTQCYVGSASSRVVRAGRRATLALDVKQPAKDAIVEIQAIDPNAKIRVVRPGGRSIDASSAETACVEWLRLRNNVDNPLQSRAGMLTRNEGTNLFLVIPDVAPGIYLIEVESSNEKEALAEALLTPCASMGRGCEPRVEAWGLGRRYRLQGDRIELRAVVQGAVCRQTLTWSVRTEYENRSRVGVATSETVPVQFTQSAQGGYSGAITAKQVGDLYAVVQATGRRADGTSVTMESYGVSREINRMVARFEGLEATPVPVGPGLFGRLDVTAWMEVVVPGEYELSASLGSSSDQGNSSWASPSCKQHLSAGRRSLTVSIPAAELRRLPEGLVLKGVQIRRNGDALDTDSVDTEGAALPAIAQRREQWSRGDFYGEESATVSGILPAPSGKFRLAVIDWEVETPGGSFCSWNVDASGPGSRNFSASGQGPLRPGKQRLAFAFDGRLIAGATQAKWELRPSFRCDNRPSPRLTFPIAINGESFEPSSPVLNLEMQGAARVSPGKATWLTLMVRNRELRDMKVTQVGTLPEVKCSDRVSSRAFTPELDCPRGRARCQARPACARITGRGAGQNGKRLRANRNPVALEPGKRGFSVAICR